MACSSNLKYCDFKYHQKGIYLSKKNMGEGIRRCNKKYKEVHTHTPAVCFLMSGYSDNLWHVSYVFLNNFS